MKSNTHWSSLSGLVTVFERIVVGVQLDRGLVGWVVGASLYWQVHQVGRRSSVLPHTAPAPALPSRSVARPEELVVVELVAASPCVPLVLGHGVWH